ncbi:M48 family metallopeptidase [Siphonobacter aquaeclarae]|uniref:Zn-dependent protease with chaperone function n=1 Tax=Siphonobacter aquaeclarae TaxID=563176 RepID=A0A1G9XQQ6_9BACT|nr:M48 family metallopeptidase [Siphonobacter aquaeclarae]SDM98746.1 Zn-dependent protease with chaperone function [Siphonobacter aquaeclarae]
MPDQLNGLYPPAPSSIPADLNQPSPEYKKHVRKVIGGILLFILTYFLVLVAAIVLFAALWWLLVFLTENSRISLLLFAWVGLLGFGGMTLFFLIKFLFTWQKTDVSGMIEIREADEPLLFEFVYRTAREAHAPLPRKIFLSPEVNAAVFYDSTFWSMFLPVRKNLIIGLGLVNALTISELKAVVGHEFGHFSQKSTRLGSYVYQTNKIIYNLLYENDGWLNLLHTWGEWHSVFAIFAGLTRWFVTQCIRVLRSVHNLLAKTNMGLSREMEFDADAVGASVAGSEQQIQALRKIEVASAAYDAMIQQLNALIGLKYRSANAYRNQSWVMENIAREKGIAFANGMVRVEDEDLARLITGRVNFKNQWASHPAREEREKYLRKLSIPSESYTEPAWVLFTQPEKFQHAMTDLLYAPVKFEETPVVLDHAGYVKLVEEDEEKYGFPRLFGTYYNNRVIESFDLEGGIAGEDWVSVFSDEVQGLSDWISSDEEDYNLLGFIQTNAKEIRTFDFDGRRYRAEGAFTLQRELEKEIEELKTTRKEADRAIYLFAKSKDGPNQELTNAYRELFACTAARQRFVTETEEIGTRLNAMVEEPESATQNQWIREIQALEEKENDVRCAFGEILPLLQKERENDTDGELIGQVRAYVETAPKYLDDQWHVDFRTVSEIVKLRFDVYQRLRFLEGKAQKTSLERQAALVSFGTAATFPPSSASLSQNQHP